jgi:hypothetical protein
LGFRDGCNLYRDRWDAARHWHGRVSALNRNRHYTALDRNGYNSTFDGHWHDAAVHRNGRDTALHWRCGKPAFDGHRWHAAFDRHLCGQSPQYLPNAEPSGFFTHHQSVGQPSVFRVERVHGRE